MFIDIQVWPNPILEKECRAVSEIDENIHILVDNMIDTCDAVRGIGLAAPQVGFDLKLFILNLGMIRGKDNDNYEVFINPRIELDTESSDNELAEEGCLSMPGIKSKVLRAHRVTINYTDLFGTERTGTFEGLAARAIQHEMDHLHGKLIVHHVNSIKRRSITQKMKILQRRMKRLGVTYRDIVMNNVTDYN